MTISGKIHVKYMYYQGCLAIKDTSTSDRLERINGYFTLNFNKIDPYNTLAISGKVRSWSTYTILVICVCTFVVTSTKYISTDYKFGDTVLLIKKPITGRLSGKRG